MLMNYLNVYEGSQLIQLRQNHGNCDIQKPEQPCFGDGGRHDTCESEAREIVPIFMRIVCK